VLLKSASLGLDPTGGNRISEKDMRPTMNQDAISIPSNRDALWTRWHVERKRTGQGTA
jgi:hypothetical protein